MDQLTIINKALMKCGLPLAAALNDCDWNAQLVYDSAVEECLRDFAWNFATRFATLAPSAPPAHGFAKGYQLPDDCLRVIDVHCMHDLRTPPARYERVGDMLYTQVSPCHLRYVSSNVPCGQWPSDFCNVVSCRIAWEIAPLSTQTASLTPQLAQQYYTALAAAQATDAREIAERVPLDVNILMARAGYENVGRRD